MIHLPDLTNLALDDRERKEIQKYNIGYNNGRFEGLLLGFGFVGFSLMLMLPYNKSCIEKAAERAAMALYEPVGNGGALSAMSTVKPGSHYTFGIANSSYEPAMSPMNMMTPEGFRRLSERRQNMYKLMDKVYWAVWPQ